MLSHIDKLHQDFIDEHAILEKEISRRENAFKAILVGTETLLEEGTPHHNTYIRQYHRNDNQVLLSPESVAVQWVYSPADLMVNEKMVRYFLNLSVYMGKVISTDRVMLKDDIISSYFYSAGHEMLGIMPAPALAIREKLSSDRKYYLDLMAQDVDAAVFPSGQITISHDANRAYWLPPYINPYSGKKALRLAAPILLDEIPFAVLVLEFTPPTLMSASQPEEKQGSYTLLSKQGQIISEYGAEQSVQPEAQRSSLERFAAQLQEEGITFVATLAETDWFLVFHCSWREIASTVIHQMGGEVIMVLAAILLVWWFLLYFKFHIFRPVIRQSERVFESEQLSRILITTAPVGLGVLRLANGELLLCSPVMKQTQAWLRTEENSLSAEFIKCYRQQAQAQKGGLVHQELAFTSPEGEPVSLAVNIAPVRYQGEDALVVAFIDITDKKQLEQNLIAAKEAADKASAAKSSFLAAMSHEIRTPLNAILGNLELLAHSAFDEQRDRLDIIRHASDRLLATINGVLDFSKIEAGELHLEHIEFDALEISASVLEIFGPIAQAKGLVLLGELGETASQPMVGDPTCLGQVLNNLLSNALKFTEQGRVMLRIDVDAPASLIRFRVEDTGIGMSASQQQQIFRAFIQADETINRRYGGTGLGLALCTQLTQAMGGELSVTSAPGQGSVFQLSLPLSQDAGKADRPLFNGERVSLLAAMPAERAYLTRVLTAWGLKVDAYQHPAQLDEIALGSLQHLVMWGDNSTWHPDDEDRLVEKAASVIECSGDGPQIPVISGRVLSTSVYGLKGLACALRHSLQGQVLPEREPADLRLSGSLRVLVAEDNPVNRHLFEEQLGLLGCTVCLVEGGEQALARLQQERFDILLTDLSMPGMDGFTLARRARELWPAMPVVAVTANATQQEYAECALAGIARVLIKPLLLKELKEMLLELGGLKLASGEPPTPAEEWANTLLGGRPLPDEMWDIFERECQLSFEVIRQAQSRGDTAEILQELHKLRGALGVYHFLEAEKKLAAIEISLKSGEPEAERLLGPFLHQLQRELLFRR